MTGEYRIQVNKTYNSPVAEIYIAKGNDLVCVRHQKTKVKWKDFCLDLQDALNKLEDKTKNNEK